MEFLRRQLDDDLAEPCGRCDVCAGARHPTEVSSATLDAARAALGRPGVEVEPRRMWPTGLPAIGVDLKGRMPTGEQAAPGRALGRLSDIGWGNRLRPLFAPDAEDGEVPEQVVDAMVRVLADWARGPDGWAQEQAQAEQDAGPGRPVGVVTVASSRRPQLVESLGARIAAVGRLPVLGRVEYTSAGPPQAVRSNSAQRVRALADAFTVPEPLAATLTGKGAGPILLVDDITDTGWTLAMTARLLRRAGATAVLPLVLAVRG
jgi:ATP-dependent DNA helicase RecQ